MKAMVFGARGGIGSAVCDCLTAQSHVVVAVTREQVDCDQPGFETEIQSLLTQHQPNWVINCMGVLGNNQDNYQSVFNTNFGSSWAIVQHYTQNPSQPVNIVLVGSTVHNQPRRNSMLYAASKTALHNLWQSTEDVFHGTPINIAMVHPPRVNTAMLNGRTGPSLEPQHVAEIIVSLTSSMQHRTLLEIGI